MDNSAVVVDWNCAAANTSKAAIDLVDFLGNSAISIIVIKDIIATVDCFNAVSFNMVCLWINFKIVDSSININYKVKVEFEQM